MGRIRGSRHVDNNIEQGCRLRDLPVQACAKLFCWDSEQQGLRCEWEANKTINILPKIDYEVPHRSEAEDS